MVGEEEAIRSRSIQKAQVPRRSATANLANERATTALHQARFEAEATNKRRGSKASPCSVPWLTAAVSTTEPPSNPFLAPSTTFPVPTPAATYREGVYRLSLTSALTATPPLGSSPSSRLRLHRYADASLAQLTPKSVAHPISNNQSAQCFCTLVWRTWPLFPARSSPNIWRLGWCPPRGILPGVGDRGGERKPTTLSLLKLQMPLLSVRLALNQVSISAGSRHAQRLSMSFYGFLDALRNARDAVSWDNSFWPTPEEGGAGVGADIGVLIGDYDAALSTKPPHVSGKVGLAQ